MSNRNVLGYTQRTLQSTESPAPVGYSMGKGVVGSYDGLRLEPPGGSTWRRFPSQAPLLKNPIFVPENAGVPLRNEQVPVNIPDDSMFIFAKNVSSPYCCPSTYSTDMGCVCTTKQQRDLIGLYRGNNKHFNTNPDV